MEMPLKIRIEILEALQSLGGADDLEVVHMRDKLQKFLFSDFDLSIFRRNARSRNPAQPNFFFSKIDTQKSLKKRSTGLFQGSNNFGGVPEVS